MGGDHDVYLLYNQHISRRYFCNLSDDHWDWYTPHARLCALQIAVEGKGSISELEFRTENDTLHFPCTLMAGQYLMYDFDGSACITDVNFNKIKEILFAVLKNSLFSLRLQTH